MKVLSINNDGGGFAKEEEIADGTTIGAFFDVKIGGDPEDYLIRVNRQSVSMDQELHDGDRVTVTPTKVDGA